MYVKLKWLPFFIITACLFYVQGEKTIGAICDDGSFLFEAAFNVAITAASENEESPFQANVVRTSPGDILEAETAMCTLLENNIYGVFGPKTKNALHHVQSIADFLEIPQLIAEPVETLNRNWSAVNLYPNHIAYSQIFAAIIEMKGWKEFTIIYEGAEHLPFLDSIISMHELDSEVKMLITVVQLPEGDDFRSQLKTIKTAGSVNYLISCSVDKLPLVLEQAQQVGLMSDDHSYIVMDPDFHTIDIDPYKHGGSNITGIRFFDPELENIQNFITSLNEQVKELSEGKIENAIQNTGLRFNLALVYDSVILYTSAIKAMGLEEGAENVTCDSDESWTFGSTLINHVRTMELDGLTGMIKFDEEGFRSEVEVDVLEVMAHGFEKIGSWTAEDGFVESRKIVPPVEQEKSESMKGKHFIVLTALSAPYGMLKESSKKLEGNDRYEGFGIEIIEELAKMNEFNYTFDIQADGVYGSYDSKTGKWNGMMEKIMDGRADFAITDLTITAARQKAVDFTSPFMNLGITILYKKPTKQPPDLFSFISPFSYQVWGYLAGAYVGVSALLFILGRFAPEEWQNPYPCIEEPETLDNQWTMANSFWFTLGSVLTQGSEIAPIAVSTRMAGSMWWFFTLIMVSSYTANLAAFLTVEAKFYAIKSVSDLASNPYGITYGAKKGGATFSFFKESDNLLYQKMYEYMDAHPELMTPTNDIGLERVKSETENYAFLMESSSIEYLVERNCDVAQVGGLLDSKGYGIAMKKNSPYRQPMSESILQLQEQGKIARMKDKWWKEKRGGGMCADDDEGSGDAQPLVLANVGGVFIVLAAGSGMAAMCAFIEMIFDVWLTSHRVKVPFKDELIAELKFIFSFSGDVKPVRHRESSGSGSKESKKDEDKEEEDPESHRESENRNEMAPSRHSDRSSHSHHNTHSRRQSNAMQMARSRKYSRQYSNKSQLIPEN
ncbi:glutamate receptor ionotropic, kainate 2-like [Maniola hyperantus]|uniref:glutamate receptor ionotropic, kainate 2-like n=1 Tax=Aphantopus hyperantus TaxID=2795564 RepID=UPI001569864E|nr:glutamate receptor ionotropic, kainate 2-like [Maniola hyperantus]